MIIAMTSSADTLQPTKLFSKTIQGREVPTLGFGTYELSGEACSKAVTDALHIGYRHVDTARAYHNETEVGKGIRDATLDRDALFLTSKVWRDDLAPHAIRAQLEASLKNLQTEYLDLLLIHWPNDAFSLHDSIATLQLLQKAGKLRHYGVSNFTPALFEEAASHGEIFCNQVEYHPFLDQSRLLNCMRSHDSALTAYSPLAQGMAIGYEELEEIGKKHAKSSEQIALRWLIEQDQVLAIPRSSNPEHIASNFDIFDFALDASDHQAIADLPKNRRQIDPEFAPQWDNANNA